MRLEWIKDILAVLDTGSFANAAEVRHLTQSAFTRRMRMIEQHIGAQLFDRSKKPVELLHHVKAQESIMRSLVLTLHDLRTELSEFGDTAPLRVSIACQHSIATTLSPSLIREIIQDSSVSVRVKSANRDACLMMLLSGAVDLAVLYGLLDDEILGDSPAFVEIKLPSETLLPVASPNFITETRSHWQHSSIPIISYPSDVFLGQQMRNWVYPIIHKKFHTRSVVETALTLAAAQYALEGLGIAWIPASIAKNYILSNQLINLEAEFPTHNLSVTLTKLATNNTQNINGIWAALVDHYE